MSLSKISLLALFIIILVSIVVYLSNQSIRLDESQTIWVASKPINTVWRLIGEDVHVPLYFTILHFWMQVFGNTIISARIPSFIFYLLTLYVLYKFSLESANKKVALLAVLLFSLSPFILWYSFEARMYTQFAFFSSLSTLFFLRMVRSRADSGKLGFFLSTSLGVYTHYFYMFFLVSQGIYLLWHLHINKTFARNFKLFGAYLLMSALSILMLVPWVIYVYTLGQTSNSEPLIPPPNSFNIFQTFAFFLFGFQSPVTQGLIVALWPMIIILQRRKLNVLNLGYFETVTLVPVLLFFLVSFIKPIFLARYLIFTVPSLFFLLANVLLVFSRRVSTVIVSLIFLVIFGFLVYQNISANTPVKENYRGVTIYLNQNVSQSDIVAVSAPFTVYPIEYSYKAPARIDTIPVWDRFNQGTFPEFNADELKKQIEGYRGIYSNLFIVLSYNQGFEDDIRSYLDENYELLFKQEFSPGLEVRKYRLRYF